jgi:anti-sigma factor RsiW
MRGKVSDQDLTDYALNELPPDERLYVESMLGVSEECREDVYRMLDLAEMLKEGLELEENPEFTLNDEQRSKVLDVPAWTWSGVIRRAAAVILLSAGIGYGVTHPETWRTNGTVDKLANAGQAVQTLVDGVQEKGLAKTAEEFTARIQAASSAAAESTGEFQFVALPAICTPTPVMDMPVMPDIVEM